MKWKKFVAAFDLHGDRQDAKAVKAFRRFNEQWNPKYRIFGGDAFDLRPLRNGASEEERKDSIKKDCDLGRDFIEWFKPTAFLRGNHDERLWEAATKQNGAESDLACEYVEKIEDDFKKLHCQMYPYHKRLGIFRMGHLKIIHGLFNGQNAAKQTALIYGSTLFGHNHVIDEYAVPGLERKVARCCGCLCQLDMDYNSRQPVTLRQAHGWAYGVINEKSGAYHVFQAESIDDKWILASEVVEL